MSTLNGGKYNGQQKYTKHIPKENDPHQKTKDFQIIMIKHSEGKLRHLRAQAASQAVTTPFTKRPVLSVRRRKVTNNHNQQTTTARPGQPSKDLDEANAKSNTSSTFSHRNQYQSNLKLRSATKSTTSTPTAIVTSSLPPTTITSHSIPNRRYQNNPEYATSVLHRAAQNRRYTTKSPTATTVINEETATTTPRSQNPLFRRRPSVITTTTTTAYATTTIAPKATTRITGYTMNIVHGTPTIAYEAEESTDQVAKASIHATLLNKGQSLNDITQAPITRRMDSLVDLLEYTTARSTTKSLAASKPTRTSALRQKPVRKSTSNSTTLQKSGITPPPPPPPDNDVYQEQAQLVPYKKKYGGKATTRNGNSLPSLVVAHEHQVKVKIHSSGAIECFDRGNFPHPLSCRKFISCSKFGNSDIVVGWEYTCPIGLSYDPVGGMCNWAAAPGYDCRE